MLAVNGERIHFGLFHPSDQASIQNFTDRAWDEVDSLLLTHGIRGTLRDAARIWVEEGGVMNPLSENGESLIVHIRCVRGGLGNATAYALVKGECGSMEDWDIWAFGRLQQEGDVFLKGRMTRSEHASCVVRAVIADIRDEASMGHRGTGSGHLQRTRRPETNSRTRYTSEDEDEGNGSLGDRSGRAPPLGARNSTRQDITRAYLGEVGGRMVEVSIQV